MQCAVETDTAKGCKKIISGACVPCVQTPAVPLHCAEAVKSKQSPTALAAVTVTVRGSAYEPEPIEKVGGGSVCADQSRSDSNENAYVHKHAYTHIRTWYAQNSYIFCWNLFIPPVSTSLPTPSFK